ncbi:antichymotrypsin-2-like [Leptopilina boulardi]|uniref:antichymotrypsin-2-like n=1 Tax=Leptopilina boulardi TaxID=63433 RepID=UPI0021F6471C|nr:antichymotrypsin-2-like [Leptopilina boulardi]
MIFTHLFSLFLIATSILTVNAQYFWPGYEGSTARDRVIWPKFDEVTTPRNRISLPNQQIVSNFDTKFTNDLQIFANNLYKIASKNNIKNVLLSPFSANIALGMLASGAEGITKSEILQSLNFPANDHLMKSNYKYLIENIMNVQGATLKTLNKVFINTNLDVKQTFKDVLSHNFHTEEQQVDFFYSEQAANYINTWVSRETNEKIKNIFEANELNNRTLMILTNVIYFKGEWNFKFDEFIDRYFYSGNEKTSVEMMIKNSEFEIKNLPDIHAQSIELPYKGGELKMIIILPNNINGLKQVEKRLETMDLKTLRQNRRNVSVTLYLPKFRVESTIDMNVILQEMGMRTMFTDSANFKTISDSEMNVSKIMQKIFIEVNENGAEAAADTMVDMIIPHMLTPTFDVNRPFHYKIIRTIGEDDGVVLFAGNCKYIQ